MKNLGSLLLSLMLMLGLAACDDINIFKKKDSGGGGGTSAETPAKDDDDDIKSSSNCKWSNKYDDYVDKKNRPCDPKDKYAYNHNSCHNYTYNYHNGYWVNKKGKKVKCNSGLIDFNNFMPYNIYWNGSNQANCSLYGPGWFPMQMGYSLVCVSYTYMHNFYPNYHYFGGNSYPRTCRPGVDCNRCSNHGGGYGGGFGYGGGGGGGLWFGGTLGICF